MLGFVEDHSTTAETIWPLALTGIAERYATSPMRSVAAFGLIEIATAGIGTSSTGSVGSLSLQDSKVVAAMTQNSEFGERTLRAKRTDPAMVHLRIEERY
jgi:hypothetical protein